MHFNLFDLILLSVFSGSIFLGFYRGLVETSINIAGFIVTILLTIILTPLSEEIVGEHIKNALLVTIISLCIAYLLSNFASNWAAKRLKEIVEGHTKGLIDRSLGIWLGAIRGYIICLLLFMIAGIITSSSYIGAKNYWQVIHNIEEKEYPKWLKKAALYSIMQGSYEGTDKLISGSFIERLLEEADMPAKQIEESGAAEAIKEKAPENLDKEISLEEVQEKLLKTHEEVKNKGL